MSHNKFALVETKVSQSFLDQALAFAKLLQFKYETVMREIYIDSMEEQIQQLRFAIDNVETSIGKPGLFVKLLQQKEGQDVTDMLDDSQKDTECELTEQDIKTLSRDAGIDCRIKRK